MERCEHLRQWALDPDVPVTEQPGGGFLLQLSADVVVSDMHCFFCGGRGVPDLQSVGDRPCDCGKPQQWIADSRIPVELEPLTGRHRLLRRAGWATVLYYCPACGGRLPASRDSELCHELSSEEIAAVNARLAGVSTIAEVIDRLGEPDERNQLPEPSAIQRDVYNIKGIKQGLRYLTSPTLMLDVQEDETGDLQLLFAPRLKEQPPPRRWWTF